MNREHALDALAVADAPDGESLVDAVAASANHEPGEHLDALLVPLDHLGVHLDRVTHIELERFLAKLP